VLLALLYFLVAPDVACRPSLAPAVRQGVLRASERHSVPPNLLHAVLLAESGCRPLAVRRDGDACDVGLVQVRARPCTPQALQALLPVKANLMAGARILAASRRRCSKPRPPRACKRSAWALYNSGSRRWWPKVAGYWLRLRFRRAVARLPGE
jgi:hypothetical protein